MEKRQNRIQLFELSKDELIDIILDLREQVHELKTQKTSKNSSIPTGKEIIPQTRTLRKKSGKRSGGQKGHKGISRERNTNPDTVEQVNPDTCSTCNYSLKEVEGKIGKICQVIDIPKLIATTTEYQQIEKKCPCCGKINSEELPYKGYENIGNNIIATISYLNIGHHLPFQRLALILKDLLHIEISEGSIENKLKTIDERSKEIYSQIKKNLPKEEVVGSDETGTRVEGKRIWEWVWHSSRYCLYAIDKSRGYEVVKKYFGEKFKGILVHDCWGPQNNTKAKEHQLCIAHILRNLQYAIDKEKSEWSKQMQEYLIEAQKTKEEIWGDEISPHIREEKIKYNEDKLDEYLKITLNKKEENKLQRRFKKHRDKILRFMYSKETPSTNNGSEQMIRQTKIKNKVSGGFRLMTGAQRYARILSIIQTMRKQELPIFESLVSILHGVNPIT